MRFNRLKLPTLAIAALATFAGTLPHFATGAMIVYGHDGIGQPFFGVSSSSGLANLNTANGEPGYLIDIMGGQNSGAAGSLSILDPYVNDTELVALAITVTDDAGSAHSLSALDDPALLDIVSELNSFFLPGSLTAYSFGSAPSQFAPQIAALSGGVEANGGRPFDILLVNPPPISDPLNGDFVLWSFDFSDDVFNNLDGITALKITDVGVIPEPSAVSVWLLIGAISFGRQRRRKRLPGD